MFIKRKIFEVQPFNFPWWPNCKYLSACYGKFNTVTNLVSLLHNYHQQNPSFTFRFTEIFSFPFELNFITILNQVKWNIKNSLFIIRLWYNCWELCASLLAPTGALVVMMVYYIYIRSRQLFQIFTQSIDAIDVTSVTLSRLNSINAIDVTRC